MSEALWSSPAKLNLFLHITGRHNDGYHELQTCFQLLDYGDELSFTTANDGVIKRSSGNTGVPAEEDLVVRAASLLRSRAGNGRLGVDIRISKVIPLGSGLGGGSSNAATTLLALNQLWDLNFSRIELAEMGGQLGADVPLFVHGQSAFAEGCGDRLQPITLPQSWYLLVIPPVHVSTREIFQAPELTRDCPTLRLCDLHFAELRNVCEPVVIERHPQVGEALDLLAPYAPRMSGTGASVFARFDNRQDALAAEKNLDTPWTAFIARGINESPLNEGTNAR